MLKLPEISKDYGEIILVYGLYEPGKREPSYIGCGEEGRVDFHWKSFLSTKKHFNKCVQSIFRNLLREGKEPISKPLAVYGNEECADIIERNAIAAWGRIIDGGCLCNIQPGGSNSSRKSQRSLETNAKRSASLKEFNTANPEVRKAAGAKYKGGHLSDIAKGRMSVSAKIRCSNPGSREAWLNATQSEDVKQRRVASYLKWWNSLTEEAKQAHRNKSGRPKGSK